MPLSQPQLDDLLERLIALTSAPDPRSSATAWRSWCCC